MKTNKKTQETTKTATARMSGRTRPVEGITAEDLTASAKGALHFDWQHGSVAAASRNVPPALAHFDRWTADAAIANGGLTLDQSFVTSGARKQTVQATVTFGDPPVVSFGAPKQTAAKQR